MFNLDSELPPAAVTEDGSYFLDVNPRGFSVILDWLRYSEVILGGAEAKDVIPVADYFGLQELCQELKMSMEPVPKKDDDDIITLDVGGTIVKTTRATPTRRSRSSPLAPALLLQSPGSVTTSLTQIPASSPIS